MDLSSLTPDKQVKLPWCEVYCKTSHDHERKHAGGISEKEGYSVHHLRYTDRIYLWICWSRRWNDDASDTDQCIGI